MPQSLDWAILFPVVKIIKGQITAQHKLFDYRKKPYAHFIKANQWRREGAGMVAHEHESDIIAAQDRVVLLTGEDLTIDQVVAVARQHSRVALCVEARGRVHAARGIVDLITESELVYGLNTELGPLAHQPVPADRMAAFQLRTIVGHAVGYGPQFDTSAVRAMMLSRANGMAKAGVGVRAETIDALIELLNRGVHPIVKAGGSIGQADLAEMSQIGLVLVGLGEAEYKGDVMPGDQALAAAGLEPIVLQVKEALGLISANGVTTGYGSIVISDAISVLDIFNLSAALSLEAFGGNLSIIHPAAARLKPHPGHTRTARCLRRLLQDSYLWKKGQLENYKTHFRFDAFRRCTARWMKLAIICANRWRSS